jgi:hypothetical protein
MGMYVPGCQMEAKKRELIRIGKKDSAQAE